LNTGPEAIEVGQFMQEHFFVPVVAGHLQYLRCPQEYWRASWAKNSSHSAASALHHAQSGGVAPAPLVLVNCDNDNLLTTGFIHTLVEYAPKLTAPVGSASFLAMLRFHGRDGGVTGRIALSASVFRQLGGYDQSFAPMGYQDVDLAKRAAMLGPVKLVSGPDLSGESVPNLPRTFSGGRGDKNQIQAKVANVAPEFQGVPWPDMNIRNKALSAARIKDSPANPARNTDVEILGYPGICRVRPPSGTLDWSGVPIPQPPAWPPRS
jgi:hypothetical protein